MYLCIYVSVYLCIHDGGDGDIDDEFSFSTKQECCCGDELFFRTAAVLLCGDDTRPNTRSRRKSDVTTACLHVEAPASIRDARRTGRRS